MKRFLTLLLTIALCVGCLLSCDDDSPSESSSSSDEISSSSSSSSEESSSVLEPSIQVPNQTKTEVKQTKKYYRQISSQYSITVAVDSSLHKDGNVFIDGIFEMNQQSQYKILSQHSELQAFSLLNHDEAESSLFEENCVVAVLWHHKGSSIDGKRASGFHNVSFNSNDGAKIELDLYHSGLDSTTDMTDVYELSFIVVPRTELEEAEHMGSITVNAKLLVQYNADSYKVEDTAEKTEAYYVLSEKSKEGIELLNTVSTTWVTCPYIAIHLDEAIETDFIINGFKYENGEMYITIQIFEKTEMSNSHELPANLLIVSLRPHREGLDLNIPDNIPTNSPINIVFEYIS